MSIHHHTHGHGHRYKHKHAKSSHNVLLISIIIILLYAAIEAFAAWRSHSLALLGDAGHMIADSLALGIATMAAWIAKRPASKTHSYGLGRAEILSAWISSLFMLLISVGIIVEAVKRINSPVKVHGVTVMIVAFIGMLINLVIAILLSKSEKTLNMRAAMLHVLSDLLGSFAALVAGAVIYFTKWYPIDPILSILIGVLIIASSFRLLQESMRILMEGVPTHIDLEHVAKKLSHVKDVLKIHDLHIWTLSSGTIALSAHVNIHEISSWNSILQEVTHMLNHEFHIDHVTLQPEPEIFDCEPCQ